jgi:hypothetical protein
LVAVALVAVDAEAGEAFAKSDGRCKIRSIRRRGMAMAMGLCRKARCGNVRRFLVSTRIFPANPKLELSPRILLTTLSGRGSGEQTQRSLVVTQIATVRVTELLVDVA